MAPKRTTGGDIPMGEEQTIEIVSKDTTDELMDDTPTTSAADTAQKDKETEKVEVTNGLESNFTLLERAVASFDSRLTLRVLRSLNTLRRRLSQDILESVIQKTYSKGHPSTSTLLKAIGASGHHPEDKGAKSEKELLPEIDVFLYLTVQVYLLDRKEYARGLQLSVELVQKMHSLNRRTLDSLAAKVYFYYARFNELTPESSDTTLRTQLLASLRTATLRKDVDTQATITVLLLRNYLSKSQITQADLLVQHGSFPDSAANNILARYSYYLGKIRAIQLKYSEAHDFLLSATRKAPQTPVAAGFIQAANKLNIVVELLMGDIPERSIFRQPMLEKPLQPYLDLVRAVRVGELDAFFDTLNKHAATFKKDGTYTLVLRLRQNVIKTGIRMMSLSYSKISLRDICVRLRLDSEESAEYIVAKAIRDGVIEASINHEKGFMQSKDLLDIYATRQPQDQFHERIKFCMQLHNECVTAMRFPMNQHRLELKNAQELRERERELAKEIQDGDIDEEDGGDFEGM